MIKLWLWAYAISQAPAPVEVSTATAAGDAASGGVATVASGSFWASDSMSVFPTRRFKCPHGHTFNTRFPVTYRVAVDENGSEYKDVILCPFCVFRLLDTVRTVEVQK